jgi:hypothetical protein
MTAITDSRLTKLWNFRLLKDSTDSHACNFGMNVFMRHRFHSLGEFYDQMDHPSGMRSGTDRMRHYRHRNHFRFYVWHGLRYGLVNRHSLFSKQLRRFGQHGQRRIRRLRFERLIEHQPQLQFFNQPEQLGQQFVLARQHNVRRRQLRHFRLYRHIQLRLHLALITLASGVSRFTILSMARHTTIPFHFRCSSCASR